MLDHLKIPDQFPFQTLLKYIHIQYYIIKNDELSKLKSKDLSNKYGINIYELNGENFNLFVHVASIKDTNKFPF